MNIFTSWYMVLRRSWLVLFWAACFPAAVLPVADAYVLEGTHWPDNQTIVLDLQLGRPAGTLIDGSTSWDQVVAAATDIWNPYLGSGVQFETQETSFTTAQGDGRNSVFFATSVFGEGFGDDTLATTAYLYNTSTHVTTEADIVFNVAQSFNSYRGPLRANGAAPVYDLRRITLHELGHVLGLDHVPQTTPAVMTPIITDIDTIQADDIAGVESIYRNPNPTVPVINGGLSDGGLVGGSFEYRISATGDPTSYSANGLPPGLNVDPSSGIISGKPTKAGTYDVTIGATDGAGTGTAILHLVFAQRLTITGDLNLTAYAGRPYYYQVATIGQPTSFQLLNGPIPDGLSLDPQNGLISGTPTTAGDFRFQVEVMNAVGSDEEIFELIVAYDATLSVVEQIGEVAALLKGSDGNLYGVTGSGGAYFEGTFFKVTPDGTVTTLYDFAYPDLDGPVDLHQAADGSFYGAAVSGGANFAGGIFKITTNGTMTTVAVFPALPPDTGATPTVLLASDGNYYACLSSGIPMISSPGSWVYKVTPEGTLTTLHTFSDGDGSLPSALIQAADGNFYGTAYGGGANGLGTVFRVTPDGTFTTLHSFASTEGTSPLTSLLQASDGNFYGTTRAGGIGNGTVFKMTPDGTLTTIHVFAVDEGNQPTAPLVQGGDGSFYGTASGYYVGLFSGSANATLFKVTPDGTLTTLHTFADYEGRPTTVPLVPDGAGNFYGVATNPSTPGTIFKETPSAVTPVYAPPLVPTVTLAATIPKVAIGSGGIAEFTLGLSAPQSTAVTVHYAIKGSASNGQDYVALTGTVKIKPGKMSKTIPIIPQGDLGGMSKKKVDLVLEPGSGYTVATTGKVKVAIVAGQ